MVIIVFGLPASGKSYFARRLADRLQAAYLSSDSIRNELLQRKTYSQTEKAQVYTEMLSRMKMQLKHHRDVVLDATFYKTRTREPFISAVKDKLIFIEVQADEKLVRERMALPREDSDADLKVYKIIASQWEPLDSPHLVLKSTNDNISEMLDKAINYLYG